MLAETQKMPPQLSVIEYFANYYVHSYDFKMYIIIGDNINQATFSLSKLADI